MRKERLLGGSFRVAHQQYFLLVGLKQRDERTVVQVAVRHILCGAEKGERSAGIKRQRIARCGNGRGNALRLQRVQQIGKRSGILCFRPHVEMLNRKRLDDLRHAANVVGMRMGGNRRVQAGHAQILQIADNCRAAFRSTCIDQHGLPTGKQQRRVALTDVDEMHSRFAGQFLLRKQMLGGLQNAA